MAFMAIIRGLGLLVYMLWGVGRFEGPLVSECVLGFEWTAVGGRCECHGTAFLLRARV